MQTYATETDCCTARVSSLKDQESTTSDRHPNLTEVSRHINHCHHCLFTVARQRQSLGEGGCAECKQLLAGFTDLHSPVNQLHISEDSIENYHFRRLHALELRLFQTHVKACAGCAAKLQNELLFIYALQTALANKPSEFKNRDGATFKTAAA